MPDTEDEPEDLRRAHSLFVIMPLSPVSATYSLYDVGNEYEVPLLFLLLPPLLRLEDVAAASDFV